MADDAETIKKDNFDKAFALLTLREKEIALALITIRGWCYLALQALIICAVAIFFIIAAAGYVGNKLDAAAIIDRAKAVKQSRELLAPALQSDRDFLKYLMLDGVDPAQCNKFNLTFDNNEEL